VPKRASIKLTQAVDWGNGKNCGILRNAESREIARDEATFSVKWKIAV
jgi:hypothetical protein